MGTTLSVKCGSCGVTNDLKQADIDGLEELIEDERSDAADDARADCRAEELYYTDPAPLIGGARPLRELATAIRRGDRAEAELLLDRIAEHIGQSAIEEVQQGRFSPLARAA